MHESQGKKAKKKRKKAGKGKADASAAAAELEEPEACESAGEGGELAAGVDADAADCAELPAVEALPNGHHAAAPDPDSPVGQQQEQELAFSSHAESASEADSEASGESGALGAGSGRALGGRLFAVHACVPRPRVHG